jgi:hypothetical protein
MPLIADYAITPDVFDVASYSSEEVCGIYLQQLRDVLLSEGIVRDLRSGEWRAVFANGDRAFHRRAKEILRKLASQGRLVGFALALEDPPADDEAWGAEALATHNREPLTGGVIATDSVKTAFSGEDIVASVKRLPSTPWWTARSSSVRLERNIVDYRSHLGPFLRCANSLQFIDPHINPARRQYQDFGDLIVGAGDRDPAPEIEIHRVCYIGSGRSRTILTMDELETDFRDTLAARIASAGLRLRVYVWDDFHDRYLISNLMGLLIPNGFDTTNDPSKIGTTWTRLGRDDRDDVQREFDPAARVHTLRGHFTIP